jgi:hypothetical protein
MHQLAAFEQCDQMHLWKDSPECSPIFFVKKYYISFTVEIVSHLFGILL